MLIAKFAGYGKSRGLLHLFETNLVYYVLCAYVSVGKAVFRKIDHTVIEADTLSELFDPEKAQIQ